MLLLVGFTLQTMKGLRRIARTLATSRPLFVNRVLVLSSSLAVLCPLLSSRFQSESASERCAFSPLGPFLISLARDPH
jgi:hypothetical protein